MRSFAIACSALAIVGCAHAQNAAADPQALAGRTFISTGVEGDQIPGGGPLTVTFDDGRISTFAGCNRGSGVADLSGGHITTQLATTMMACTAPLGDSDAWMAAFFAATPSWALAGDTLTLRTGSATVALKDKKVVDPDRPLTGTTWQVQSLVSHQGVTTSAALEQAKPTLIIAPDGAVTGSTGCNRFNGHATISGATVELGPLAVTRKACGGDVNEIEQAMMRVLNGRVTYSIDADQMKLTRDDGYGLVLRAQAGR